MTCIWLASGLTYVRMSSTDSLCMSRVSFRDCWRGVPQFWLRLSETVRDEWTAMTNSKESSADGKDSSGDTST